jgi:hypothetical protein
MITIIIFMLLSLFTINISFTVVIPGYLSSPPSKVQPRPVMPRPGLPVAGGCGGCGCGGCGCGVPMGPMGMPVAGGSVMWWKNSCKNQWLPSGKLERSTMLLMGKSTISTGPFSIAMFVYQRIVRVDDSIFLWFQFLLDV